MCRVYPDKGESITLNLSRLHNVVFTTTIVILRYIVHYTVFRKVWRSPRVHFGLPVLRCRSIIPIPNHRSKLDELLGQ
jgi:hypothetical protein